MPIYEREYMVETARRTLTVLEAARVLGVGRGTAYELVRSGQLPALRLGPKRIVIPREGLNRLLAGDGTAGRASTEEKAE